MNLYTTAKTLLLSALAILFSSDSLFSQGLDIDGTAKAGSYEMGTVKMVPAGSGFKSIRFENASEILAEFNASFGIEPPEFKIGKIRIGDLTILNPVGFPKHLFINEGGTTLLAVNRTSSSMTSDQFSLFGLLSVSQGVRIAQNVQPFSAWRISVAPATGTLEFFLDETLKARINTSGTYSALSDRRCKAAIEDLDPSLANVLKLRPKSYVFKDAPDADRSIGFIAQEVAEVFPELVQGDPSGEDTLSLDYSGFGVMAIKAIQEQQLIIDRLVQRLSDLEVLLEKN